MKNIIFFVAFIISFVLISLVAANEGEKSHSDSDDSSIGHNQDNMANRLSVSTSKLVGEGSSTKLSSSGHGTTYGTNKHEVEDEQMKEESKDEKEVKDEQSNKSSGEREGDQRRYRLRDFMPIVDSPLPGRESVQKLYNLYKKKLLSRRS